MTRSIAPLPLILASASPRRRQLLRQAGLPFRVMPSRFREGTPQGDPEAFVQSAALGKAREVAGRVRRPAWVLAADTVVVCENQIFGKPNNRRQASAMLRALAGRSHQVFSGVALLAVPSGKIVRWVEKTEVRMRALGVKEICRYLDSGQWRDKAGGYGIQARAGAFVDRISGCYFNVVGLPLSSLCERLGRLGLWPRQ